MAKMSKMPKIDGPIPGENYTEDTKNFPWHRPPEETDFVKIVNRAIKNMSKPENMAQMLTALESGDTILEYVTGTARISIGNGKLPIDQAVLAAGPIARFVESAAKQAGIPYEMGFDIKPRLLTPELVRSLRPGEPLDNSMSETTEEVPTAAPEAAEGGFMSMDAGPASPDEQNTMLGA